MEVHRTFAAGGFRLEFARKVQDLVLTEDEEKIFQMRDMFEGT